MNPGTNEPISISLADAVLCEMALRKRAADLRDWALRCGPNDKRDMLDAAVVCDEAAFRISYRIKQYANPA